MKPVIVIASHQRREITRANLKSLKGYDVVLVLSDKTEVEWYRGITHIHIVIAPNEPLGSKWDAGVQYAKKLEHSHIIITGSDDIMCKGYIEAVTSFKYDFVGLRQWYVLHKGNLYHFNYLAANDLPLGGGRCYSKQLLEYCDYQIFDTGRYKLLDDLGFDVAVEYGNYHLIHDPMILAVKGDWETMNPFKKHMKSANVAINGAWDGERAKEIINLKFDYEIS